MTPRPAPADFTDWPALLDLLHVSFRYMEGLIDPPSSLHRLDPPGLAAKALTEHLWIVDPPLVACAYFRETTEALYIGKLAVHPKMQGQGLGRALILAAEKLARDLGLPRLQLETRIELTDNHAVFARLGFAKTGEKVHEGFDRPTSITMEKPLF